MTSQDDVGMLWYGVSGLPFNPADPAEVMLNAGTAAPLLSDQPRSLITSEEPLTYQAQHARIPYADQAVTQQNAMLYNPNTGDYINQPEYMYESYDGYEEDSCGPNNYGSTSSTNPQDSPNVNSEDDGNQLVKAKKPKVHQHPSLKLKTPIAYRKDTDLDAIPIMKEGMAVCEICGAIGVKHAFYGKERKFCSLICARGGENLQMSKSVTDNCHTEEPDHDQQHCTDVQALQYAMEDMQPNENLMCKSEPPCLDETSPDVLIPRAPPMYLPQNNSSFQSLGFDWASVYLNSKEFTAAPVPFFKHAPMSECWEAICPGLKVEVSCDDESTEKNAFWVATVIHINGYLVKLRYEGLQDDSSKDFWMDICSVDIHPVGWCARQGHALVPPKLVEGKCNHWKDFLKKRLTGARTLPTNFHFRVTESQKSRFRPGLNLEVVDKNRIAQMRVATVTAVIGKRIHLRYHGASSDDNGFWCHEDSPIIHPVGWSRETGHEIVASQSYHEKCMQGLYESDDATPDLFMTPSITQTNMRLNFCEGMKIEALDPLNLSSICVATIMKVLQQNYLMIRIDSYAADDTGSDWFCYHASSPYIFSPGFCESHNLSLSAPKGYIGEFSWESYLTDTESVMAPPQLFQKKKSDHNFQPGMYIEAADLMDPRLVCVASVKQVESRLLKIHFDGWDNEFEQWVDCESSDIYPVGWCTHVGYRLEGPRPEESIHSIRRKKFNGRGGKKGRPSGSRKIGVNRGIENDSPERGLRTSNEFDNEQRNIRNIQHSALQTDSIDTHILENTAPSLEKMSNPRGRSTQLRKTPLGASNQTVRGSTRPVRSTRTSLFYNGADKEDRSDETSSCVASLCGSDETSKDGWDEENLVTETVRMNGAISPQNSLSSTQGLRMRQQYGTPDLAIKYVDDTSSIVPQTTNICDGMVVPTSTSSQASKHLEEPCTNISSGQSEEMRPSPYIPRIVDRLNEVKPSEIVPKSWTPRDVSTFLQMNDCGAYGSNFVEENIDGKKLLTLAQTDVMNLTRMKVGPSLKVHALIQQLLAVIHPAKARYQATMMKRGMVFHKS